MDNNQQSKFKIRWDEKERIIKVYILGVQDEESATGIKDETSELVVLLKKKGVKVIKVLGNMTRAGIASTKARKIFAEWFKGGTFDKIALFGGGVIQKTIAGFIFNIVGFRNAKYFDTEGKALKWLREKQGNTVNAQQRS